MRKAIVKLAFVLGIVTGGLVGGLSQSEAEAALSCPGYCLDPACTCVIECWRTSSGCVCEDTCTVE
ncbi:hypothetical protein F0U61_03360 [Archangium violaceum]|uniref:hypothetical protein n=1 Tax=Archangium violaceum TaxID=83451 RepID=UPI002B2956E4|nr:hypothetical protein F0U61_03360 [Archangium violaceum]